MSVDLTAIEGIGVLLSTNDWGDPRIGAPQARALDMVAKADPGAKLLGFDHGMRPVVAAQLGIPRSLRVYAIQRNGDPTEPNLRPDGKQLGLAEVWTGERRVL